MEGNLELLPGTQTADADLSAKQFYIVKLTATGTNLAGNGEEGFVLQNKPESGDQCSIGYKGVTNVIAGAAFDRGVELASDADGKAITATTGEKVVGIANVASLADGNIVSMILVSHGRQA